MCTDMLPFSTPLPPPTHPRRCIKFLRLFTNKGQKVAVGKIEPGSERQARNVTKNRNTGLLVALRGWQDLPKKFGEYSIACLSASPVACSCRCCTCLTIWYLSGGISFIQAPQNV